MLWAPNGAVAPNLVMPLSMALNTIASAEQDGQVRYEVAGGGCRVGMRGAVWASNMACAYCYGWCRTGRTGAIEGVVLGLHGMRGGGV